MSAAAQAFRTPTTGRGYTSGRCGGVRGMTINLGARFLVLPARRAISRTPSPIPPTNGRGYMGARGHI